MSQMQNHGIDAVSRLLADGTERVGNVLRSFLYFGPLEQEVTSFTGDAVDGMIYQVTATKTNFNPRVVDDFNDKLREIVGSALTQKQKEYLSMALLGAAAGYLNGENAKSACQPFNRESTLNDLLNSVGENFELPKLEVANFGGNFFINNPNGGENTAAAELVQLSTLGMVIHGDDTAMKDLVKELQRIEQAS